MAKKRITELATETTLKDGQYVAIDHATDGTKKLNLGAELTDLKEDLSDVKDNLMVESSQYITAWKQGWIRPDGSTGTSGVDCRTDFLQMAAKIWKYESQ